MMEQESILQEAERIINGDRREDYGIPLNCFNTIAALWNAYLYRISMNEDRQQDIIDAHDVAMMMCLMKISRTMTGAKKRDTYVDIAGYAALAADL